MKSPLRNASLTLKVALAPTLVLLCLVVVAVHGYLGNRSSAQALNGIVDASLPRMATTGALLQKTMQLNGMVMQSLAYEGAGFKAGVIAELDQRIGTEFKATRSMIVLAKEQFTGGSPEAQALLGTIATAFGTFERAALDTLDMKSAGLATASSMMSTSDSSYAALRQQLEALAQLEAREGGAAALTVKGLLERANTLNFFLTVTALGVSLALILFSLRLIVQPLTEAQQIARSVAQGDLSGATVEAGRDETGQVLQALADVRSKLGGIVSGIRSNALAIETASHEIADGSAHLSQRTENTAATLQTTSSSLTRVTASIRANADGAAEARRLSAEASAVATAGGKEVSAVIDIMSGIHADGRSITEIIGTIDSIAFQTNILALNAAVEAARAGDQGRGFAVVSSEVRALAQRSAEAARQVRALITASVERVDGGMDSVSRAGKTMQRIVDSIGQVNATVATMAEATMRQADTIQEVSAAVADIERDTQQNAALVEQASAAAETLNESAGGLVQAVAAFRVG